MSARKSDASYLQRGAIGYQSTHEQVVRGSLLAALLSSGLLPVGTLSQATPPSDTSLFWIDEGTDPETLKYHNGTGWVAATFDKTYKGVWKNVQVFTASGSFVVPCPDFYVEIRGGGGGGNGGRSGANAISPKIGGSGGGQGGFASKLFTNQVVGSTISVTIGAGGAGGAFGDGVRIIAPSGGTTDFGGILTASGGSGGALIPGAIGGDGFGGDVNIRGLNGYQTTYNGGTNDLWSGGAGGGWVRQGSGSPASGFDADQSLSAGAGGTGATVNKNSDATDGLVGGAGADGLCKVYY